MCNQLLCCRMLVRENKITPYQVLTLKYNIDYSVLYLAKIRHVATVMLQTIYRTIGVVVRMPIWDTKVAGSNLSINMFSLSKRLYPHCFSRLSCEMSTRWGQPREGCSVL